MISYDEDPIKTSVLQKYFSFNPIDFEPEQNFIPNIYTEIPNKKVVLQFKDDFLTLLDVLLNEGFEVLINKTGQYEFIFTLGFK